MEIHSNMSMADRAHTWEEIKIMKGIEEIYSNEMNDNTRIPFCIRNALGKTLSQWEIEDTFGENEKITFINNILLKIKKFDDKTLISNWKAFTKAVVSDLPAGKRKKTIYLKIALYDTFKKCIESERMLPEYDDKQQIQQESNSIILLGDNNGPPNFNTSTSTSSSNTSGTTFMDTDTFKSKIKMNKKKPIQIKQEPNLIIPIFGNANISTSTTTTTTSTVTNKNDEKIVGTAKQKYKRQKISNSRKNRQYTEKTKDIFSSINTMFDNIVYSVKPENKKTQHNDTLPECLHSMKYFLEAK